MDVRHESSSGKVARFCTPSSANKTGIKFSSTPMRQQSGIDVPPTVGVDVEIIDVRTLMRFDIHEMIGESVRKTNRVLDEDVPGGATASMMYPQRFTSIFK